MFFFVFGLRLPEPYTFRTCKVHIGKGYRFDVLRTEINYFSLIPIPIVFNPFCHLGFGRDVLRAPYHKIVGSFKKRNSSGAGIDQVSETDSCKAPFKRDRDPTCAIGSTAVCHNCNGFVRTEEPRAVESSGFRKVLSRQVGEINRTKIRIHETSVCSSFSIVVRLVKCKEGSASVKTPFGSHALIVGYRGVLRRHIPLVEVCS